MKTDIKYKIIAICLLLLVNLQGCRMGDTKVVVNADFMMNDVFKIGDEVCTLPEARVILTNYQNIYGKMYGINLWDHQFEDNYLETYLKDLTISRLAQIMAMEQIAQEKGIALTKEEKEKAEKAAEEYFDSLNSAEKEYMQVKQGNIEKLYLRFGLANKLYTFLTQEVNDEVSDEEARVMQAQQIFVSDEAKAQEVAQKLREEEDFLTVANLYNEAAEIEVFFCKNDVAKEMAEQVFSLQNDEISRQIKSDQGFYFIKCINHYDQEKTDANKSVILENRRKEAFDDVYQEFLKDLPSEFHEEVWEKVKVEADEEVTTDSFFLIYEKYCNW